MSYKKFLSILLAYFQTLEDFVIADIARRIAKAGNITDMAEWQLIRAEEIGMADKVIKMKNC
ncbi:hypothetical protein BER43_003913 [Clostridioides difficile]|uniref:phage minor capsid protein n=1 Tax=Clostridioides difficile TaxID=1496 RepID=UPI00097B77DF|nr:phage minor capsid protein [Clostridioides difficile]OMK14928.1 hypothetical protein BER43_003913 [Clostridioides difficile]